MDQITKLSKEDEDQWFQFLGYGNPLARIWFIGSEPGGDAAPGPPHPNLPTWQCCGKTWIYGDRPDLREKNSSWDMMGRVLENIDRDSPQDQWNTAMLANMAPLPRRGEDQDHGGSAVGAYVQRVRDERISFFRQLISAPDGPRAMIFFGKGASARYGVIEALQLKDEDDHLRANTRSGIRHFDVGKGRHVVLMNHPSRPRNLPTEDQRELGHQLVQWLR